MDNGSLKPSILPTGQSPPSGARSRTTLPDYAAAGTAITQADAALAGGFARLRQDGYSVG